MYTRTNYPSKKALVADVKAGKEVAVYQPGPFPGALEGWITLEGPHYPKPHRWYASARIEGGIIKEIRK